MLTVPVGDALLGRVVAPLGVPILHLDSLKGAPLDGDKVAGALPSLGALPPGNVKKLLGGIG